MHARFLSPQEAQRVYDRIGRFQDAQAVYERRAIEELLGHADLGHARAVFELGFGTGSLAVRLLEHWLPETCRYVGIDVSPHMVRLASERLRPWRERAEVRLGDGSLPLPLAPGEFDRVVSAYVLDLQSPADARTFLAEAHRVLAADGLLCLVSLTPGTTGASRLVTAAWQRLWALRPQLVGGCRPIELARLLPPDAWTTRYRAVVTSFGVSSEVVVASRAESGKP